MEQSEMACWWSSWLPRWYMVSASPFLKTTQPLGAWLQVPRHTNYEYYRSADTAFWRDGRVFHKYRNPTRGRVFRLCGIATSLPLTAHPVSGCHNNDTFWTQDMHTYFHPTTQHPSHWAMKKISLSSRKEWPARMDPLTSSPGTARARTRSTRAA